MPRGYRCIVVAALGWLALTAGAPKNDNGGQHGNTAAEIDKAANTISSAISNASVPGEKDRGCQDRSDKRDSDLCAQWKAADAAHDAAEYARWSILIGIIGTGLLIWTLAETRETAIREQRAYVKIDFGPGGVVQPDKQVCIPILVINYGTTPAVDIAVESCLVVRRPNWDWADEPNPEPTDEAPRITLHPDTPYLVKVDMDELLPAATHEAIMRGDAVVYAKGRIAYRDVFKRSRETTFQFEFHGGDRGDGTNGAVRFAAKGNNFK